MPELPEVESARQVIEASGLGRLIVSVDDRDTYECRPHSPGEIEDALVGRRLREVHRRGKLMWCTTSGLDTSGLDTSGLDTSGLDTSGPEVDRAGPLLGLHLGMSGRIIVSAPTTDGADSHPDEDERRSGGGQGGSGRAGKPEWYRFSISFEDGGRLRLLDKRRLGRVRLDPDLDALGPDAGEIGRSEFRERVGRGTAPLKARLLDQGTLAGVGNLLADEVLWQSRLDPRRPAGELDTEQLDALRRQLRRSIRSAISHGGVHTGEVIEHRHTGGHCPRCGAEMSRGRVGGRTTWWCTLEQG